MFKLSPISLFFACLLLFCYLAAYLSAISPDYNCFFCDPGSLAIFTKKVIKISLAKALYSMLALIPTNQLLAKDIWLEFVVQDGRLEVREAKKPQKVSILL